jgi:hypothetical protein
MLSFEHIITYKKQRFALTSMIPNDTAWVVHYNDLHASPPIYIISDIVQLSSEDCHAAHGAAPLWTSENLLLFGSAEVPGFSKAGHADFWSEAGELRSRPCWISRDIYNKSGATGSMEDVEGQRSSAGFEVCHQAPNASPVVATKIFCFLRT